MEKIKVEAKFGYSPDAFIIDENVKAKMVKPSFMIFNMKREGKDGFESTVKIPLGDVSSEEFAKAVKALHLAALAFHHHMYSHLKEQTEEREDFPAIIKKDQRGS